MTKELKEYRKICDEIADKFAEITEKDGYWMSDYCLWVTEFEAWTVNDMLLVMERYSMREDEDGKAALLEDVEQWIQYNVEVNELGIAYINLGSWLLGAPRMTWEEIDSIKTQRKELEMLLGAYQIKFGKADNSSQPMHLRTLKNK